MKEVIVVTGLQTETVFVDDYRDMYQVREAMLNRATDRFSKIADLKVETHVLPIHEYLLFMRGYDNKDPFAAPIVKEHVYFCLNSVDDKLIRQISATFDSKLKDKDQRIHSYDKKCIELNILNDKYKNANWFVRLVRVFKPAYRI